MSRLTLALAACSMIAVPQVAFAWGKTGHRVVGTIAEKRLDSGTRDGVQRILGVETLAEASTWPDEIRADPSTFWQETANPWHYVTVPAGKAYPEVPIPSGGDAVTALARFAATVRDSCRPLEERALALRFIVHIVGDLHQPLHAGNGTDRGGNDRRVTFQARETNLHSVWDSGMIDAEGLSFTELAGWLDARTTPDEVRAWSGAAPAAWIAESTALRDRIYPDGDVVSSRYVLENMPHVKFRLRQAGVRLAGYLDRLFADGAATRACPSGGAAARWPGRVFATPRR